MTVAFLTIPLSHTPCQPIRQQRFPCSSIRLHLSPLDVPFEPPLVAIGALLLAFSAQSWINSLLGGDQGLGAFLSDGTGMLVVYLCLRFLPRVQSINNTINIRL